jgi:hypothetical protein
MGRPRVSLYCRAKFSRVFVSGRRAALRTLGAFASCFVAHRIRQARHAPLLTILALTLALCGCSASRVIDLYAADYRDTAATAGDSQLLLNILRAKDDLPIHFSDLSIIHGSIQLSAGATSTLPFAHFAGSTTPSSIGPTVGAQSSPTFDMGTLDTQDFTKGMLSPINPQIVKQLFDQGVDPRLIMLLFFSEYQSPDNKRFYNNMACDHSATQFQEPGCKVHLFDYLDQINRIFSGKGLYEAKEGKQLQANIYVVLTPVGGPLTGPWTLADNLGDLSGLDTKKFKLDGKRLYSISDPQVAICYYEIDHKLHALFPSPILGDAACNQSEVKVVRQLKKNAGLTVRSPYEILQFLGQVLRYQEEREVNRCLTLSSDRRKRLCDTGEVLFQVNAPVGTPVVATRYRDGWYALYSRSCNRLHEDPCDYSLQVLAILELLLNANKAANDIPSTPRVQVVP